MATSTCGKCGGISFELKEVAPKGSRYKFHFVQCASCGVPVGVVEYTNIGARLDTVRDELQSSIRSVGNDVQDVDSKVRRLSR